MGYCWAKWAVDYAKDQIGNICGKGYNKYAEEMDAVEFYNYPKNGSTNSCSIFVDNCVYHGCDNPTYNEDPDAAKWTALTVLYEPQAKYANAGAGCVQSVDYFKKNGAFYTNPKDFERGDKIFFADPKYSDSGNPDGIYHTGIIVDWDERGFQTVEGNTSGGIVDDHFYEYGDYRIYGAGRPNYDGWEPKTEEKPVEPVKENKPEKPTKPTTDNSFGTKPEKPTTSFDTKPGKPAEKPAFKTGTYTVDVNDYLRIRSEPKSGDNIVGRLFNGAKVTITEVKDGYGKICDNLWVFMDYLD